jgi:hypothetical protein
MLSRPNFEVDIVKSSGKTLSFTCSYVHPEQQSQEEEAQGERTNNIIIGFSFNEEY